MKKENKKSSKKRKGYGRRIKTHPLLEDKQLTWVKNPAGFYITYDGIVIRLYFSIAKRFDGRWRLFRNTYGFIGDFKTLKKAKEAAQYIQDNSLAGWE